MKPGYYKFDDGTRNHPSTIIAWVGYAHNGVDLWLWLPKSDGRYEPFNTVNRVHPSRFLKHLGLIGLTSEHELRHDAYSKNGSRE